MTHDIFISYSSKDKAVADAVCRILEERKIQCWIAPRNVPPGKPYARALVEAIGDAKAMVLIFSSNACNSEHVMRELEQASKRHVVVIPFRIEDAVPTPEMDYHISRIHWIDALTPPVEVHIHKLADHLVRVLGTTGKASLKREVTPVGGNAKEWLTKGDTYLEQKQYQEAFEAYNCAITIEPLNAQAWALKGFSLSSLGRHQEAVEAYNCAIAIGEENAELWIHKGNALNNSGRHQEALEAYDQALAINPKNATVWNNKGISLTGMGQHQQAIKAFDQALAINPKHSLARKNRETLQNTLQEGFSGL